MIHANAPLTPIGRQRLAESIVVHEWPVRRAAERFQVSSATASKWAARYRDGLPMTDASAAQPVSLPATAEMADRQAAVLPTVGAAPHRRILGVRGPQRGMDLWRQTCASWVLPSKPETVVP